MEWISPAATTAEIKLTIYGSIENAGNPPGIAITRVLLMLRNGRQVWLSKKDSWLMVGNVVTIGREMDGWSDLLNLW